MMTSTPGHTLKSLSGHAKGHASTSKCGDIEIKGKKKASKILLAIIVYRVYLK